MGEAAVTLLDGSERRLEAQSTVGRDEVCEVRVEGRTVSRRHALLVRRDGRWWIADTGSANGTFLNDDRVPPGVYLRADPSDLQVLDSGSEEERAQLIAQRLQEWNAAANAF